MIWIILFFIFYLKEYVVNCLFERSGYVFGMDMWNEFGFFYYFVGFNGYLLLGYYVKKGNDWSFMKIFIFCIFMFVVGYYIIYIGFSIIVLNFNVMEMEMEFFFIFCSFNVLLMILVIFLLL